MPCNQHARYHDSLRFVSSNLVARCQVVKPPTNRLLLLYPDYIHLERTSPGIFTQTRVDLFNIPENIYQGTLRSPLTPISNLGLSGSIFFHTSAPLPPFPEDIAQHPPNAGLFIKSIGRAFEYEFMYEKLLPEYLIFMRDSWQHEGSLLSRITDVLCSRETNIGALLKITPRHYMVMVDIIGSKEKEAGGRKWDLKPPEFFEVHQRAEYRYGRYIALHSTT